jgi:TRAP-type C4-dicarboxylate transport system permease small subunit
METVCAACGYQRKPTDQAPEWQCPACGKAYAKTLHESSQIQDAQRPQRSLSGYAQNIPPDLAIQSDQPALGETMSDGRAPPDRVSKPLTKGGLIFGLLVSAFFIWGIPILSNPSSASDVLMHGNLGFVAIALIAIMGLIFVSGRLSAGVDRNNPMSKFAFLAKVLGMICAVFFILLAIWLRNQERTEDKIQLNGQRVMADVVRIYTGSCGRHSCSIDVEYAYTPTVDANGMSQRLHGYAQLGTNSHPDDLNVAYARANQRVPIAYNIDHPEVSALNFNDDVFLVDHEARYRSTLTLIGSIFLGIFLIGLVVGGLSYWSTSGRQTNPD